MKRPEIHQFHDYRIFLRDWFEYRKQSEPGFSVRNLSKATGLASGYLPMVLSGKRPLSTKALQKMAPQLGLRLEERTYLENLLQVDDQLPQQARHDALQRIQRSKTYRGINPREVEVCQYLSKWYLVAIREMVALADFKEDPRWIQERLKYKVPVKDIERAIEFLINSGFLLRDASGKLCQADKSIECLGRVYSISLAQFHKQMLELASGAIDKTPTEQRNITGHTLAIPKSKWQELVRVLGETLKKVSEFEEPKNNEEVYHVVLGAFPLTSKG